MKSNGILVIGAGILVVLLALVGCNPANQPAQPPGYSVSSGASAAVEGQFTAMLSGMEEVPAVNTMATGQATFMLNPDGTSMTFTLSVAAINNVTAAHIHRAAFGVAGGVVVPLFTGPAKAGEFTGVLAQGTITGANLTGALLGMPLSALVAEMNAGNTYVNVHTTANPGGEIRGQIKAAGAVVASK